MSPEKPLGQKAYGHIPHLPGSRLGVGDHHVTEGQARICCEKARDRHDWIVVQEKVDGSNVCVALLNGVLYPLIRAGYTAINSHYEQHHLFAGWAFEREDRFRAVLHEGERLCGEWLAQVHGTRYDLTGREPFVAFDLMTGTTRETHAVFMERVAEHFTTPRVLHTGKPFPLAEALEAIKTSGHGALDPVEGAVWRAEHRGKVDFLAKYVRPDKLDGCYLPSQTGGESLWNWRPNKT
jgi:hypothetical protein